MALLIGSATMPAGLAQKGKNSEVTVTAVVNDSDPDVAASLQIQSDGGAYLNSSTVASKITNTGVWALDLRESTRMVSIQFTDPVPGSGPNGGDPVAPPSGFYNAWLYSSCNHFGNNPLTMMPGQTITCPMAVVFDANGDYILHMNGNGQPETNAVAFTCLAPSSGSSTCGQWRVTPTGAHVARLSLRTTSRGQTVVTPKGNFHIAFSILLTR
jgi:hypothetical protein